jgi:hypothetical protein
MPDGLSPTRAATTCVEINIVVVGLHKDVPGGSCKWHREADMHFDAAAPDVG